MNFTVSKAEFVRGLQLIQSIVQRRTTMPVLSNVLIHAGDGCVTLTATDLDVGMKVRIASSSITTPGVSCVNARKLYEVARETPEEEFRIRSIDSGKLGIESGKVRYQLFALEAKEFPSFPDLTAETGVVDAPILEEMIVRTLFAVSADEIRPDINGVLVAPIEENIRMVGTDGHRMALSEKVVGGLKLSEPVILPRKGLHELKKLCEEGGEIRIGVGKSFVHAETTSITLFIRTVEGQYPNYERVIPTSAQYCLRVGQPVLLAALRRVAVLSTDRFHSVRLHVSPGLLELTASNPELGEAREEVSVDGEGPEIEVSFNSRYIMDAVEVLPPNSLIEVSLIDQSSPGVVRVQGDPSYLYVVMPVRS
jgi:DNA polymerase-3 subunit beta